MWRDAVKSALLDILAGVTAICFVLGSAMLTNWTLAKDLRAMFALTATAFFFAGLTRGRGGVHNLWLKGLLVGLGGILGTGTLIMNDGFHRLPIPITMAVTSVVLAVSGVQTRRFWNLVRGKSWALGVASLVVTGLVAFAAIPTLATYSSLKNADRSIRFFTLSPLDGGIVRSSDLRGHVVVLAFWTTWCLPCHWELPELEPVYRHFQQNPEVVFWAVDMNWDDTPEKAKNFLARKRLDLPGAFDSDGAAQSLGVDSLPTVVLIDKEGRVRMVHYGYDASENLGAVLSAHVERLLGPAGENMKKRTENYRLVGAQHAAPQLGRISHVSRSCHFDWKEVAEPRWNFLALAASC